MQRCNTVPQWCRWGDWSGRHSDARARGWQRQRQWQRAAEEGMGLEVVRSRSRKEASQSVQCLLISLSGDVLFSSALFSGSDSERERI
jgi:hypothetical protein